MHNAFFLSKVLHLFFLRFYFTFTILFYYILLFFTTTKKLQTQKESVALTNVPKRIRTSDTRLRRAVLYPAELLRHCKKYYNVI